VIAALRISDLEFATPAGRYRISLEIEAGQSVVACAEPPVGRALARTVVGLAEPLSGEIRVGLRPVTTEAPAGRQMGYVPAGGALLPHLTIQQNIEYALRRRDFVHEVSEDWVKTVIDRLELVGTSRLLPHLLSDAQRLRVALARAAASRPEILVIDLPEYADGTDQLTDLLDRVTPANSPGIATLVCSPDPGQLRAVTPLAVQA
jgi:ABC-type sulfate/molybdate transport systems ATPase subunit